MNKLFFQTRKVGLSFCMKNFSCNIVTYTAPKNELNFIISLSCMGKVHNNWLSSPRAMDNLYPVSNVLIPKISLPIHNTFLSNKWDVTLQPSILKNLMWTSLFTNMQPRFKCLFYLKMTNFEFPGCR